MEGPPVHVAHGRHPVGEKQGQVGFVDQMDMGVHQPRQQIAPASVDDIPTRGYGRAVRRADVDNAFPFHNDRLP